VSVYRTNEESEVGGLPTPPAQKASVAHWQVFLVISAWAVHSRKCVYGVRVMCRSPTLCVSSWRSVPESRLVDPELRLSAVLLVQTDSNPQDSTFLLITDRSSMYNVLGGSVALERPGVLRYYDLDVLERCGTWKLFLQSV
jgi:hypothetical protein